MPLVHVFLGPRSDPAVILTRLTAVADVVGRVLELPADGVVATHVPTAHTVWAGHSEEEWPLLVVHGRPRQQAQTDGVLSALRELAGSWTSHGGAEVTWVPSWVGSEERDGGHA